MKRIERQLIECMYDNLKIAYDLKEREPIDSFEHYDAAYVIYRILYKCGSKKCTEKEICSYVEKMIETEIGYDGRFKPKGYIDLLKYLKITLLGHE